MLTDTKVAHPWIFEDAGLRLEDAADLNFKAVEYFNQAIALNEGMVEDIEMQRDFIDMTARSLKAKGLHFALTIAAQDARTVNYDQAQFNKVCARIRTLLEEDIENGFAGAEVKLKEFNNNPEAWLKSNLKDPTYMSTAQPDWSKWVSPY